MDRLRTIAVVSLAVMAVTGCGRQDSQLQQHEETMESLSSSTSAIVDAWLHGSVSGTYTATALEQMLMLVEQDRSSLTASSKLLIDRRGAVLADSAAELSQRIANLLSAVQRADSVEARAQLAAIPFRRAS